MRDREHVGESGSVIKSHIGFRGDHGNREMPESEIMRMTCRMASGNPFVMPVRMSARTLACWADAIGIP